MIQLGVQRVGKDSSRNRNPNNTAHQLRKRHCGRGLGDHGLVVVVLGLDGDKGVLERCAESETKDDLVADELCSGHVGCHCVEETGADGGDEGTEDEPVPVSAGFGDDSTRDHGTGDGEHHEGEDIDSGTSRRVAL